MAALDWQGVKQQLRREVGEAAYRSWLQPLEMMESPTEDEVRLSVPTKFMRNWIETHYGDRIRTLVRSMVPSVTMVEMIISSSLYKSEETPAPANDTQSSVVIPDVSKVGVAGVEALVSQLDARLTFESFVVGKPNELAFAAARRVAEAREVTFNPLFLYGGVGLGKTHLMKAIAWHIAKSQPQRRVLYLSAEKFMYEFIKSLRHKDTMAFKELFRSVDVLMIDDVQFISGKESTQEEFFHTFNALVDQNRQVVVSADKSPSDLEGMEARLKSRLGWGLVADIHPTTYELRLGILQSRTEILNIPMPKQVLEFLAHKITSNVRELEGALNRIAAHAMLIGREVTLEGTQELLRDVLRANLHKVSVEDIQKKVADHYNVSVPDLLSARRSRTVARPRQVAMYLAKQLTTHSLPSLGRSFGGRDHTTVLHAIRNVESLLDSDRGIGDDVKLLQRLLQQA
jgi:chromosomal replication initiator protein